MPDHTDNMPQPQQTLGQRIDALLGPLDQEAQAFREAITGGRAQMAQMQARIDQAEHALAGIEEKMIRVLKSLAAEEPMLALAMGSGDELPLDLPTAPTASTVPPVEPAVRAPVDPAPGTPGLTSAPPPVLDTPKSQAPPQRDASAESPQVVTLEMETLPVADPEETAFIAPTAEEDAAAVDEIHGLLDAVPELTAFDAAPTPGSPLADAAAQADAVARALDGGGE